MQVECPVDRYALNCGKLYSLQVGKYPTGANCDVSDTKLLNKNSAVAEKPRDPMCYLNIFLS